MYVRTHPIFTEILFAHCIHVRTRLYIPQYFPQATSTSLLSCTYPDPLPILHPLSYPSCIYMYYETLPRLHLRLYPSCIYTVIPYKDQTTYVPVLYITQHSCISTTAPVLYKTLTLYPHYIYVCTLSVYNIVFYPKYINNCEHLVHVHPPVPY